jgi:glyoxylase-like metal-dependent hydrolase (beta-lactamase superfamily II)
MDQLKFQEMTLTWLNGGVTKMDGGAMFGPVPKPLWEKRYPANERNQIELTTEPILLQYKEKNYLIDAGIGSGRLTEKQKRIFGVTEESTVEENLKNLNLTPSDIDAVLMTHLHFDHVTGLVEEQEGKLNSFYPNATIYVNRIEWEEIQSPNRRSSSSYWEDNWRPIKQQVYIWDGWIEIIPGIELHHTGGHSNGHAIVKLSQGNEVAVHLADIFPTHVHQNPLWVTAYDDYPMDAIKGKEKWIQEGLKNSYKFLFYHDAYYRMVQWDETGKDMLDYLKRSKQPAISIEAGE